MKINRLFSIVNLLYVLALLVSACSGEHDTKTNEEVAPVTVTLGKAQNQINQTVTTSGKIEAKESAVISTRVMGFITSIKVKAGERVEKGQLLATINNADILAKRAQAQALITEAEAALRDAKKDFERFETLYNQQSASAKEFENITLHYNSLKTKVDAAYQMRNEADAMLNYTNLTAPFAGVVTQTMVDEGSMANPGMPILAVEQQNGFQVKGFVTETDINTIKTGSSVTITVKAIDKTLSGKVIEVSPSSQMSGGQYSVIVSILNAESKELYSGMVVQLAIEAQGKSKQAEQITLVPATALVYKDQLVGLYTISESKTALLRWVRTGKTYGDHVQILSGLSESENFILKAEGKLYNGVPVHIQ